MLDSYELKYLIESKNCRGKNCHSCKLIDLCDFYNQFNLKRYSDVRVDYHTGAVYIGDIKLVKGMTVELMTPIYSTYTISWRGIKGSAKPYLFEIDECIGRILKMSC